jgi:hypothetical protein
MSTEIEHPFSDNHAPLWSQAAPSDAQLGAALRKIAEANGQTTNGFAYYAKRFVEWASDDEWLCRMSKRKIHRVKIFVQPAGQIDGVLERAVEMLAGHNVPGTVSAAFGEDETFEQLRRETIKLRALLDAETARRKSAEERVNVLSEALDKAHGEQRQAEIDYASMNASLERIVGERRQAEIDSAMLKAKLDRLVAVLSEVAGDA